MEVKLSLYKTQQILFKSSSMRLDDVLKIQQINGKKFDVSDVFVKNVRKNEELAQIPVINFVGNGSSAVAFETADGNVLKLSEGNHFPLFRPQEDFDVPIYKQGRAGKINYYIEEKLMQHGMTSGFVEIMRDMIKEKGYRPYDLGSWDIHQVGLSSAGKLYLIDPECARFKTIFHALWKKAKTTFVNKLSFSHFSKALRK